MKAVQYRNLQTNRHTCPTIIVCSSFGSSELNKKRCSFKHLDLDDQSFRRASSQYDEYMNVNHSASTSTSIQKIEEQHTNHEDDSLYVDGSNIEEEEYNGEVLNFLEKSKLNTYKNIIFAFFKHIQECSDPVQQDKYVELTEDKWEFKHISLRVYQNLRNCGRSNLKIKNLIQNRNLKGVFINFLENSDKLWIDSSKIKDKEGFKKQINLIIQAYRSNILAKKIQFYKKHKK